MKMSQRKITIVGGGAVGGIIGAYLARSNFNVKIVDRWKEHVCAMREGLIVDGCREQFRLPLNALLPEELEGPLDLVLLAVKAGDTANALKMLNPMLGDESIVITLQNGINEDMIAAAIGAQRTMGCIVGWGATSVKAGHLTQTSLGLFILGSPQPGSMKTLKEMRDILATVSECHITENIYGFRWLKLLGNCSIATATLLGKTIGEALEVEKMPQVITALVYEGLEVAAKAGINIETLGARFSPDQYLRQKDFFSESIISLLQNEHKNIFPAFYQDILKGRKSEIDYINGYVVAKGLELEVPTPVNDLVVKLIHEIEENKRPVGPDNLKLFTPLLP